MLNEAKHLIKKLFATLGMTIGLSAFIQWAQTPLNSPTQLISQA